MSEYVPTTEQVRTDYVLTYTERESSQLMAGAAFDRWIAAHDREVKAEAWDEGYMRGMYPWSDDGQEEDPIPAYMSPPSWGQNSNPYRIESEARP